MSTRETQLGKTVGIGHRPQLAADLLARPSSVGFVEIVAEACYAQAATRREALAIREIWPVVPHGVKLSLGSAEGLDAHRLDRLASLTRELRAPLVSEHVAFTRGGGREIGHLTQLPRTREAIRVVQRNVEEARRRLPDVPLLLENVAFTFRWPEDEMDEATFYGEIVEATGCDLLLDVGNLYGNALNEGLDPRAVLSRYPLESVAMLHVAGGASEGGFYFDTHADPVPEPVFELVETALQTVGSVPILLERDSNFPSFDELLGELTRLGDIQTRSSDEVAPSRRSFRPSIISATRRAEPRSAEVEDAGRLAERQGAVAEALTVGTLAAGTLADTMLEPMIDVESLERARDVLRRKRIDNALPLLPRLGARCASLRCLARRALSQIARGSMGSGPRDALHIAALAEKDPSLRDAAKVDALLLRARFRGPDTGGSMRPRVGPFVGIATLGDGKRVLAAKGFGAAASIYLQERRKQRWRIFSTPSPTPPERDSTS